MLKSLELKCKVAAVVILAYGQAWNDYLSRAKLSVVLLMRILDDVELVLVIDLLNTGCHARDSCLIDLLLQHALVVLELHGCLLQLGLITVGDWMQPSLLVLTWLVWCGGQVEH